MRRQLPGVLAQALGGKQQRNRGSGARAGAGAVRQDSGAMVGEEAAARVQGQWARVWAEAAAGG